MAQWKALPDALDEQGRRFVTELRRLKSDSGLSLAALAARTSCSRSSWERYLNGTHLAPVVVVGELAQLGGGDVERALALRALAAESWSAGGGAGRAATTGAAPDCGGAEPAGGVESGGEASSGGDTKSGGDTEPAGSAASDRRAESGGSAESDEPVDASVPPWWRRRAVVAAAGVVTTGVLVAAVVAFLGSPWTGEAGEQGDRLSQKAAFVFEPGRTHACDVRRAENRLQAGHSDTHDALLQQISTSWDVVEAQCLLEHRGYSPGVVDGAYGADTEKAVKRFQEASGLVADGIMGPHTWEALRR
ncbi:peptidoglycan-binding protein [Streptomyces sp. TRM68416]|uniref:peptidoglycan-binding protein n=1 Tax=Streptomyces sp. TRM68416 TaxID=2758412 RepID=UPI002948C2FE|nr:peptidoglycan-binding protein [Streptomyces sp. TRM68416]